MNVKKEEIEKPMFISEAKYSFKLITTPSDRKGEFESGVLRYRAI